MKAFPCKEIHISEVNGDFAIEEHKGMDLRDYFAAKAMQSILLGIVTSSNDIDQDYITSVSYDLANSMMEAREK